MSPRHLRFALLLALANGTAMAQSAQAPGAQAPGAQAPPSSPVQPSLPGPQPPAGQAPPEKIDPPTGATGSGVIRPPGQVDPGIHTTVPDPSPNTTPVIPPPGSPGGSQNRQPR